MAIDVVRDLQVIVTVDSFMPNGMPERSPNRRPAAQGAEGGGWTCDQMPSAPACRTKSPNGPMGSRWLLTLIISCSVIVCFVVFAVMLVVAFRCRRRLCGGHQTRRIALRPTRGRRGVQYRESDPPLAPLVVTADAPERSGGQRPLPNRPADHHSVGTLLTPPDYEAATLSDVPISPPVPPSYELAMAPKDENSVEVEEHALQDMPTTTVTTAGDISAHESSNAPDTQTAEFSASHIAETCDTHL